MASDRAQYNRALRRWDELHAENAYSVPVEHGKVAILSSNFQMEGYSCGVDEAEAFLNDALNLQEELRSCEIEADVFYPYTLDEAAYVLEQPMYSSVVTIGNGDLSSTYTSSGDKLDWHFVAQNATHLKEGNFIQRHCGHAIRTLPVPLGTFALTRHSNVLAAFEYTLPTIIDEGDERMIKRLHRYRRLGYHTIKYLFPSIPVPKPDDD